MIKKKILFLSAWYPTRFDPMTGLFVKRHAELLSDYYEVTVLHTLAVVSPVKSYEVEVSIESNVNTVRVFYEKTASTIPVISHIQKLWRFFKAHHLGYKSILERQSKPQLVHVNILTRVGLFALYLKLRYHIPYVITEHWSRYLPERSEFRGVARKAVTKIIVKNSAALSTVSENLKQAMIKCGLHHANFRIVYNVVDNQLFRTDEIQTNTKELIFSHVSCFDDKAKNVTGIVRAIALLTKKRNDFVCLMVGEGVDWLKTKQLASDLGIDGRTIQFTGLKEGQSLVSIYNESLFTLLFSNYENMPVVISESLCCGKPLIATHVGGIPEIINDTTGILIPPKNEEKLAAAIDFMLNNHHTFNANEISNIGRNKFGNEAVLTQLIALYQTIFTYNKQ